MNKKIIISIILLLTLIFTTALVQAQPKSYHLKLLAVQETPTGYEGSDADLYLELKQGTGNVFLNTFPITKMDTQISTRFAKELACKHYSLNCDQYDFLYTIRAQSNIIGGPSAGAAIAAITVIAVEDLPINENVAITGTINSGGVIGPVGGIKEKIEAAARTNLRKVLISKGNAPKEYPLVEQIPPQINQTNNKSNPTNQTKSNINSSINKDNINNTKKNISNQNITNNNTPPAKMNLIAYAQTNLSVEIIEVTSIEQVLYHITGKNISPQIQNLTENPEYSKIMINLKEQLCNRGEKIERELRQHNITLDQNFTKNIQDKNTAIENATIKKNYYSAASMCFSKNIQLKKYYYDKSHPSQQIISSLFKELELKTLQLEKETNQEKIETISDLQTKMVVKERLDDVRTQIKKYYDNRATLKPEETYAYLAYAQERYSSALSWQQFFTMNGKKFNLDQNHLQTTCMLKISEAEERHNYISFFLNNMPLTSLTENLNQAKIAQKQNQLELCLMKAMQAKADANALISSLGVPEESFNEFIEAKEHAAEQTIAQNSKQDIFPILGYSYYQYAKSLKDTDKYTSLVYQEYALELSDLQIYFPEEKNIIANIEIPTTLKRDMTLIGEGILLGFFLTLLGVFGIRFWKEKYRLD